MSKRAVIIEIINKLFVYTDYKKWDALQYEVFAHSVHMDKSSLGGPVEQLTAQQICNMWKEGFKEIDAIDHLAGNHLVSFDNNGANVFCYATANHYKKAAKNGDTRTFVGSYDIHLTETESGWRIDQFKYNLKYMTGNIDLV